MTCINGNIFFFEYYLKSFANFEHTIIILNPTGTIDYKLVDLVLCVCLLKTTLFPIAFSSLVEPPEMHFPISNTFRIMSLTYHDYPFGVSSAIFKPRTSRFIYSAISMLALCIPWLL